MRKNHYSYKAIWDIRTGKNIYNGIRPYKGPFAQAANVRFKVAKTWDQLGQAITPMLPGQPEMLPWTWYDTATYTSGTTTQLDFFQTVQADKVLGNMQAAGQIPAPMYFEIHHIGVHFDIPIGNIEDAAAPLGPNLGGPLNDINNLIEGSLNLTIAQKVAHETKIGMCPAGYGPTGDLAIAGTIAAATGYVVSQGTNGIPDLRNRNNFWGMHIIPHNQNFLVRMNWTAAITLNAGNTTIVTLLDGYLYRRVL